MNRLINKMIATVLVTIMLLAYAATIGIYANEVYALENSLEVQGVKTNNENVEFDAFFISNETKIHEAEKQIGDNNSIYLAFGIKNAGYLKNAKVEFTSEGENRKANFMIREPEQAGAKVAKVDVEKNTIELNQINKNEKVNIEIPISFDVKDRISIDEFSKENVAKLTGTYMDANGKEKQIKADIKLKLNWMQASDIAVEEQIAKYIPYSVNGENGVLVQTIVNTSIVNNAIPVKSENIEIVVPTIANIRPTSVKVVANSTKATNGDEKGTNFTNENYTYDEKTGKLIIKVGNEKDEENNVSWNKNTQDQFVVTYIYPQEILTNMPEDGNKVVVASKVTMETYGAMMGTFSKEINEEVILKDKIGELVDFTFDTNVENLSKGYIYANYEAEQKIETEYKETINANIGDTQLVDSIVVFSNVDNFVYGENSKVAATEYTKELSIAKNTFDKFIGEEGYINIFKGETLISTINKDTQVDENGNIKVNLAEFDANMIAIQTSKPLKEGILTFEITKAIKGENQYTKPQMKTFSSIETVVSGRTVNNQATLNEQVLNKNINLTEPVSVADISINNDNLSTVVTNKDVEIRAVLKTNSLDCKLYKNPTVTISLPSYIESINVKSTQVLFDDELKVKAANLVQKEDGTKDIVLELEGTQTKYNVGNIAGGTNIVLNADIDVNKLTPNIESEIKMNYTNENLIETLAQLEQNQVTTKVGFTAPVGIVTMNGISNYKDGAEALTSISGEEQIAKIDILSAERQATFNMSVMNNYTNTIENVVVLGRVPFNGNKSITKGESLGSTMDLNLTTPITVGGIDLSKVTIYYSENAEATKDLTNTANGWTTEVANLSAIKSYLIVTTNNVMNTGDSFTFNYNAQIPANLQHNQSAYETYTVYFTNNLASGTIEDKQETAKVGVTTGKGAIIEASIDANVKDGETILSDSQIIYTVTVKNTGDLPATNLKITLPIPEGTKYTSLNNGTNYEDEKQTCIIDKLDAGATITKDFAIITKELDNNPNLYCTINDHFEIVEHNPEGKPSYTTKEHKSDVTDNVSSYRKNFTEKATIEYEGDSVVITTDELANIIKNRQFLLEQEFDVYDGDILQEGDEVDYLISVNYVSNTTNTVLETNLPSQFEYKKITLETIGEADSLIELDNSKIVYDKNTGKLQIKGLNGISNTKQILHIYLKVKETDEKTYKKEIKMQSSIFADGIDAEKSSEKILYIVKNNIKITQTCSVPDGEKVKGQEELIYKILIESQGDKTGKNTQIEIIDELPTEVIYKKVTQIIDNVEKDKSAYLAEDNKLKIPVEIQDGTNTEIYIYTNASYQDENIKITNRVTATINNIKMEINSISHIIEALEIDENIENEVNTQRISGQVWIDENKDGIKDKEEKRLENIKVMLINLATGKLQKEEQFTNEEGRYLFTGISEGGYAAIFLYDTANYSSTTYKKEGVDSTLNSDAIDMQITLDGVKTLAAITEEIVVTNSNIYNIDLGLIVNPKFDLSLDKTVSKITIQNSTGTKTYDYENTKLAKRDLVGKEIGSTTAVIEYKLKVTNEGAISGYVKKIADYLPQELKFSSELNQDWYQGDNGTLYNSSLANTLINPGETKEVTLVVTKKLNENDLSLIQNSAEIYEAYNDLGLEDIDSKAGNKATNEDDYSSADVLFTVKTGETILFIALSLGIISTIAVSAYMIKRKIIG